MNKKVEILAPAGSYESLKAAIAAGADAVYIGGTRFGARAFADNLSEEKLLEVIDYVHLHGRKIYLTVNTLLKEQELQNELYQYLLPYYKQGLDAVIVQDLGVLKFIKEQFPRLPIHASTQMTITDLLGAKFMQDQGVERVVTAREMNIREIREIADHTDLEIESFVHGALCYCYSGQCLYSSLIGGRSGNRGQCAQPCRLPYKVKANSSEAKYILSLKDICTLEYIPELIESGIHSFKIEGRMKKPEYVALVTKMYRKYVDLYMEQKKRGIEKEFKIDPKDKEKLLDLYNRGGSHGGYYHKKNGRDMISIDRPNHAGVPAAKIVKYNGKEMLGKAIIDLMPGDVIEFPVTKKDGKSENYTLANAVKKGQTFSIFMRSRLDVQKDMIVNRTRNESLIREIQETIINKRIKEKIKGKLILSKGISAKLILTYGDITVEVNGKEAESAKNQPIDTKTVEKQIRKTGNTEFEFEDLKIEIHGDLFVPMQNLNELRRMGLEALENAILSSYRRNAEKEPLIEVCEKCHYLEEKPVKKDLYVYVEETEQFDVAVCVKSVSRIYLDVNALKNIWTHSQVTGLIAAARQNDKEIYLAFPHIFRSDTKKVFESNYEQFLSCGFDGVLIRNMESFQFLKEHKYEGKIVTDHNLYHFNKQAKAFWEKAGIDSFTAPFELNYKELNDVGLENGELIIYGYQPMMVSAQCVLNTTKGCQKKKDRLTFMDRYHKSFTVKNLCDYCYNVIYNTAPLSLADQKKEIDELGPKAVRLHFTIENAAETRTILNLFEDVFIRENEFRETEFEFTRGHFKRGIK